MDFIHKYRLVAHGHKTTNHEGSTYADVVYRETIIKTMIYDHLMALDIIATGIHNLYMTDPTTEKLYIICGNLFVYENIRKEARVKRASYGTDIEG